VSGFRKFLLRGNLIDLAVAVVIAARKCMYCTSDLTPPATTAVP